MGSDYLKSKLKHLAGQIKRKWSHPANSTRGPAARNSQLLAQVFEEVRSSVQVEHNSNHDQTIWVDRRAQNASHDRVSN